MVFNSLRNTRFPDYHHFVLLFHLQIIVVSFVAFVGVTLSAGIHNQSIKEKTELYSLFRGS